MKISWIKIIIFTALLNWPVSVMAQNALEDKPKDTASAKGKSDKGKPSEKDSKTGNSEKKGEENQDSNTGKLFGGPGGGTNPPK